MKKICLLSLFVCIFNFGYGQNREPLQFPEGVVQEMDIVYATVDDVEMKLNVYWDPRITEKQPLVVFVHGGGWRRGTKDRPREAIRLLNHGYTVASISYRLSGVAKFPAQIIDCKAAIRWLRANADQFNYDPGRIGVWGASAGGHLVAMLGTSGNHTDWDVGENLEYSSKVQAVVNWFGPTDFMRMNDIPGKIDHFAADSPESLLIGGPIQEHPEKVKAANPITYIDDEVPPMLIMHGEDDDLVLPNQSILLYEALVEVGHTPELLLLGGQGHGGSSWHLYFPYVRAFFDKTLKH